MEAEIFLEAWRWELVPGVIQVPHRPSETDVLLSSGNVMSHHININIVYLLITQIKGLSS